MTKLFVVVQGDCDSFIDAYGSREDAEKRIAESHLRQDTRQRPRYKFEIVETYIKP